MSAKFEAPHFDVLHAEQEAVQSSKLQSRQLVGYSSYIFPGEGWCEPRSDAVTDFLRPVCLGDKVSLEDVFNGMYEAKSGEPVCWVDMGGGLGLPMRQLASNADYRNKLIMTNVDVLDLKIEELEAEEIAYLEGLAAGMTDNQNAPQYIQADAETVILTELADAITSIEAMQYLNNPLAAISNWYNQLADNGVLIISTEHDWTSWVRYQREPGEGGSDKTPTEQLLKELASKGVAHAASCESDRKRGFRPELDPGNFRNLVIQKRPGTQMVLNAAVTKVWVNPHNFKAVYYEESRTGECPLIKIIGTESCH